MGISCRAYLALKMNDSSGDLVVNYYLSLLFDCGRKWIRRIASVWQAKLSGESEMAAADVLRVRAIRVSGHAWPGKLNRLPLPSSGRRIQMWDIRMRWNVGRIEWRLWDIRVEWAIPRVARGTSACPRERKPRDAF